MTNYNNLFYATDRHYIANCGHDERGQFNSGKAGDQSGDEFYVRTWYKYPYGNGWDGVLRYEKNPEVGKLLAILGIEASLNDHIGYDNWQRWTYETQLKAVGDDPSKVKVDCETDCSASIIAHTRAVGRMLNIPELANITATYTGNMRDIYIKAGFTWLTDAKYKTSPDYLLPGDLLLNIQYHTATNLTVGKKVKWNGEWLNMDKTKFVSECYTSLLMRNGTDKEIANWVAVADTKSPLDIMTEIAYSPEGIREWVVTMYKLMLNRNPDKSGLEHWTASLRAGKTRAEVLDSIKNSPEYKKLHGIK